MQEFLSCNNRTERSAVRGGASNQLTDVSPLQRLTGLMKLGLSSNHLTDVSPLQWLTALKELDLSSNQLTDVSPLQRLTALTQLDLSSNLLTDVSPLQGLSALKSLYLQSNQLTDVSPLQGLSVLKKLYLQSNQLTDISPLQGLTTLNYLYLSSNQLTDVLPLQGLITLKELYLYSNQLTDVSPLLPLIQLKRIYLQNNKITQLPEAIFCLGLEAKWGNASWRDGLHLSGNPLETPPIEIVKSGTEAVLNYFKELKKASVRLLQCKLLIVGNGEVGKTTLMNKLLDPNFHVVPGIEDTTRGIHIQPWELEVPFTETDGNMSPETVTLHFWDFGGQEIYHATHQFFLTKRSLYILVWEARKDEEIRSFDYWLNVVKLLGSGSPVLIVLNKADIRIKPIDEASILKKFPEIKAFLHVSCLQNTGLMELKQQLQNTLAKMPHLQDLLPASWLHIRDELKSLDTDYTNGDSFFTICHKHNLARTDAITIGDYLHDLGSILYFRHDPLLADTVILKPQWATKAVYALIDTNEIILNNGSFLFADLKRYWDLTLYPEAKHPQLIRLMEKFDLCFNFLHTQKYFIPELLPGTVTPFDTTAYDCPGTLHFQYHYKFMPEGILSRFMARLYYLIHLDRFWKYGVELQFEASHALIISQPLHNRITIQAYGPNKSQLLAIIRSHFFHIHQTLNMEPMVHYNSMLPCICTECVQQKEPAEPEYFAYEQLKKALANHIATIQCHASMEQIVIATLLHGFEPADEGKNIRSAIIQSAKQVMGLATSMKPDEDSRTGLLCVLLNEKGFMVKDQTRWGQSETGKSMGRLDAKIDAPDGEEAVLEAFKLEGFDTHKIKSHNQKIFNYDPVGLQNNFILVYCDGPQDTFIPLWKQYQTCIQGLSFPHPLRSITEEVAPYAEIKMARAIHLRHEKEVGIYHIFINMYRG